MCKAIDKDIKYIFNLSHVERFIFSLVRKRCWRLVSLC